VVTEMKTNVKDSSIEAYYTHICGNIDKKKQILDFVKSKKSGTTGREIATVLGMDTATVSGLVKPAVNNNELIRSETKSPCPVTRNPALWLHHPDNRAGQLPLI